MKKETKKTTNSIYKFSTSKYAICDGGWNGFGCRKAEHFWMKNDEWPIPTRFLTSCMLVSIYYSEPLDGPPTAVINVSDYDDWFMGKRFDDVREAIRLYNSLNEFTTEELHILGFD